MKKIIYSKYSNERARRFALRTDLVEDEANGRVIVKKPLYAEGAGHMMRIDQWGELLGEKYRQSQIRLNHCVAQKDGSLVLEYLEGQTLEHELDEYLAKGNLTQLADILFEYLEEVKKGFLLDSFHMTEDFREVFGDVELPTQLISGDLVDIDMVLNNVIVNQGWTLIDYEWTFSFPIPYHFVVYRILQYYLHGSSTRNPLQELNLMERAGLTEREIVAYEKMERHFQDIYVVSEGRGGALHVPIRDLYDAISPGTIDLRTLAFGQPNERMARLAQLYESDSTNFTEEKSQTKELYKEGIFLDSFHVQPASQYLRLDPCSKYCVLQNLQMQWGGEIRSYRTNGIHREDGSIFFPLDDPQIIVERPQGIVDEPFRVYFEITYLTLDEAMYQLQKIYAGQRHELDQKEQQIQFKDRQIQEMENTKVWKAYRKIKGK